MDDLPNISKVYLKKKTFPFHGKIILAEREL